MSHDFDLSPPVVSYNSYLMGVKYTNDLYRYHRKAENERRPAPNYVNRFESNPDCDEYLNPEHRFMLVKKLVPLVEHNNLNRETLHLAVSILDRYWSCNAIEIDQMVPALGCLVLAAKLEEATEQEAEFICGCVTRNNLLPKILEMGQKILDFLKFNIWSPTTHTFLWKINHIEADCDYSLENLGECLAGLSLLDYYFVKFLPSMTAASVVFLAKFILKSEKHPWSTKLQRETGYSSSDLKECVLRLYDCQKDSEVARSQNHKFNYRENPLPCVTRIPEEYFENVKD